MISDVYQYINKEVVMFTREKAEARFAAMPDRTLQERFMFWLTVRCNRRLTILQQRRYDVAPPCSCNDPNCERNFANGIIY